MSFRCETSDDDDGGDDDDDDEEVDVRDGDGDDDDLWCLSLHVQSCRIKMSSRDAYEKSFGRFRRVVGRQDVWVRVV